MCCDFRALNQLTVRDSFPLPRIDDLLNCLNGAEWFSAMDATMGYHQVPINDIETRKRTGFSFGRGMYQWRVMPFGLVNAPAIFQRAMEDHLRDYVWKICLVYLDDVIVFATSWREHLDRLAAVFEALRRAGVKLK